MRAQRSAYVARIVRMNNDKEKFCPRGCALVTVAAQKIVGSCLKLIFLLLERWFDKGCKYSAHYQAKEYVLGEIRLS